MKSSAKRMLSFIAVLTFLFSLSITSAYACESEGESVSLDSIGYTGDYSRLVQLLNDAIENGQAGQTYYVGTTVEHNHVARAGICSCGGSIVSFSGIDEYRIIPITCPTDSHGLDLLVEFRHYTGTKCTSCGTVYSSKTYADDSAYWMVACLNGPVLDEDYTWYEVNPKLNNPHSKIDPNDYT